MGKLSFTCHKTSNNKAKILKDLAAALIVSISAFLCLFDLFGFSRTASEGLSGGFAGGLVKTWNTIAAAFGSCDFILLPKIAGESGGNGLFLTVLLIVGTLAAYMFIKERCLPALLIFILPLLALDLFFRLPLTEKNATFFILAILLAVLYVRWDGEGLLRCAASVIIICSVAYPLFHLPIVSEGAAGFGPVRDARKAAVEFIQNAYYGKNPLRSGDLGQRKRDGSGGTALRIKMEKPRSMYLRGYIGDVYNGKRWETLSNSAYYAAEGLMERLGADNFRPLSQVRLAKETAGGEVSEGQISVEVAGADTRYVYVPYEIKATDKKYKVKGGSFIAPGLARNKSYSYTVGEDSVKDWTDTAARIFTAVPGAEGGGSLIRYLTDESHYNEFVYHAYTYVSIRDSALLGRYFSEKGDQSQGHIDYKTAINKIRGHLDENFIYTENIGGKSESGDPLREFLEGKKGYDVHFATAAALMFRYFGIPARYVEGYLVTPGDVERAGENGEVNVSRKRAHAWTEIYIDGTGFVPIEVSPPYRGVMEEADMDVGISNNTLLRQFEAPKGGKAEGDIRQGGDSKKHKRRNQAVLAAILAAAVLGLVIRGIIKFALLLATVWKRNKLFKKGEPKLAVSAIYGYMEKRGYKTGPIARELGNKAAYSREPVCEEERKKMLVEWEHERKKAKRNEKRFKKRVGGFSSTFNGSSDLWRLR